MSTHIRSGVLITLALTLAACGGSGGGTGRLNLAIGDAPVDGADQVVIVFTGVEIHSESEGTQRFEFAQPRQIDLLDFQDGATVDLLDDVTVPAGQYVWMRLNVIAELNRNDGSFIHFETGEQFPLFVPSGAETGLKLNRPFRVAAGGITRLVADFDLRKSILAPLGLDPNYVLMPVLRLTDALEIGDIDGTVDLAALATAQLGAGATPADCAGGIYLFAGGTATPDDQDMDATDGADPILFEPLPFDGLVTAVPYHFAFVEAGNYTVAATCDFDVDALPDVSEYNPNTTSGQPGFETMHWTAADNVIVAADQTVTVNLP